MAGPILRGYGCLMVWVLVNIAVFVITYKKYLRPQYYHVHTMLGSGLCVSRAAAAVVNLNATLVLLPVCRGLNSLLFRALNHLSRPLLSAWLARLVQVHTTLAITIIIAAVIHSIAHLVNSVNFSRHYNNQYQEINWAKYKGQSPILIVLTSSVGLTGVAMLILLLLMLLMSLRCVRARHYDLFWATHFLFLPFLACLILHPLSGVLKEQSNYSTSTSSIKNGSLLELLNSTSPETQPTFSPMECQGWRWVLLALSVFSVDSLLRLFRRNQSTYHVSRVVHLPAGATRLTLSADQLVSVRPGQYILLKCPRLSSLEWHPFTVTSTSSTSSHTNFTVLIRRRGDWTSAVCNMLSNRGNDQIVPFHYTPVRFLVDGPYCSPMENVLKSRIAICIAAGIGVTPFIAVLQHLYENQNAITPMPCHLHFIWVVRTSDQLLWAINIVMSLHHKFWDLNQPDRFEFAIFVTKDNSKQLLKLNPLSQNLLEKRMHLGRPNWKEAFTEWASLYHKKKISVFVCGPPALNKKIQNTAKIFNKSGHKFTSYHEAFS